jgi:hypothetical protein
MSIPILYQVIDWTSIESRVAEGETGTSSIKTLEFPGLRVRMVEYSAGYLADHWCAKGHVVHCLKGSFVSELLNGEASVLEEGMSYVVTDEISTHRSRTENGVTLLIIDGDFLR